MKKLPTSGKARSMAGWRKHLKPYAKHTANKGTRRIFKSEVKSLLSSPADL